MRRKLGFGGCPPTPFACYDFIFDLEIKERIVMRRGGREVYEWKGIRNAGI